MKDIRQTDLSRQPVFIVAPTGKCGTNFLAQALISLGICEWPSKGVLGEHYLLHHATLLKSYVDQTGEIWGRFQKEEETLNVRKQQLFRNIGNGILKFVGQPENLEKRFVLKTPSSQNLIHFFDLFPNARLIVLVRDGRDATESQVRAGYQPDYQRAFDNWSFQTRQLLEFIQEHKDSAAQGRWLPVRFEDLVNNPSQSLQRVAKYLGRELSEADHAIVKSLPVFGSSFLEADKKDLIFEWKVVEKPWQIIKKPEGFDPTNRWKSWDAKRKQQFKDIAGRELIVMGYESDMDW